MKHYLLFVLLLLSLISNAQVKKKFYGVPFSTSKEQAKVLLKNERISFKEEPGWIIEESGRRKKESGRIVVSFASIGDYSFDKATMCFIDDRFYKILFYKKREYPYHEKVVKMFNDLHRNLSKKYSVLEKKERDGSLLFPNFVLGDNDVFTTTIVIYGKKGTISLSYCYSIISGEISLDYCDEEYLSKQKRNYH